MSKKNKYNDTDEWFTLIPELKEWNDGRGINHETWAVYEGRIELALAYTSIFWPDFILFKDGIFIGPIDEQTFDGWNKNCKGNMKAIEATLNHIHLDMMFENASIEQYIYMGKLLKTMWETKLITQFPKRHITVDFDEKDYTITVYQEH